MPGTDAPALAAGEVTAGWTAITTADQPFPSDSPLLRTLNAYWWSIKPAEGLPGRQHFDPLDVPRLLPWIYLFDVVPQPDGGRRYRFRLIGTGLVSTFGRDSTGSWLEELYDPEEAARATVGLERVVSARCPIEGALSLPTREKKVMRFRRLVCPLAADGRTVDMLLGIQAHNK
jgi:hypothetical protein